MKTPRLVIATTATAGLALLAACGGSSTAAGGGAPAPITGASGSTASGAPTPAAGASGAGTTTVTPAAAGASQSPAGQSPARQSPAGQGTGPGSSGATTAPGAPSAPAAVATLPDGTTTILPGHRVVAYYGASVTPPDNALPDAGTPQQAATAVLAHAKPFAVGGEPVLGAFELIATIIQDAPGPTGSHAADIELSTIARYEDAAVKNHLLLVLDIQPGTDHYLPHVQRLAKFLMKPNVSIALDPEWQFLVGGYRNVTGNSPASDINTVSAYLSQFVASHHLPQKLLVLHQFTTAMIPDRSKVASEPGVATVMHIDGIGNGGNAGKIGDYKVLHGGKGQFSGFKLFFKEDTDLMSPAQVLALSPKPDLITYQ